MTPIHVIPATMFLLHGTPADSRCYGYGKQEESHGAKYKIDHEIVEAASHAVFGRLLDAGVVDAQAWRTRSLWKRFWEFLALPLRSQL